MCVDRVRPRGVVPEHHLYRFVDLGANEGTHNAQVLVPVRSGLRPPERVVGVLHKTRFLVASSDQSVAFGDEIISCTTCAQIMI